MGVSLLVAVISAHPCFGQTDDRVAIRSLGDGLAKGICRCAAALADSVGRALDVGGVGCLLRGTVVDFEGGLTADDLVVRDDPAGDGQRLVRAATRLGPSGDGGYVEGRAPAVKAAVKI
ncbi:hypothetical protein PG994_008928 [Apiospora phragmitis]|uniref:Uncharacterized protein n=1 Tax=Apiospora phragmitis TaxID=2905665 RepID=A0ABR1UHU2_9PEZI